MRSSSGRSFPRRVRQTPIDGTGKVLEHCWRIVGAGSVQLGLEGVQAVQQLVHPEVCLDGPGCMLAFTFTSVPGGQRQSGVSVPGHGTVWFSRAELSSPLRLSTFATLESSS